MRATSPGGGGSGPRRRKPAGRRIAGGLIAVAILGGLALGVGKITHTLKLISGNKSGSGGGGAIAVIEAMKNPRAQFPGKGSGNRVNILLLGKDYDRDKKGMPFTSHSRADSIMLLSLDLDTEKVSALSIPRDSWITDPRGHTGKINGAMARGGAKLMVETITDLLAVKPDYYIALKPDAVRNVVDALGGVDVETIGPMDYDDNWGQLHIHLPAGRQTITGEQAVGFARFREIKPGTPHSKEEGDPRRMARQQQLIRAMAAKGKSMTNLFKVDDIINIGFDQIETDLSRQQIVALVALFRTLQPDQMQTGTLEGTGEMKGHTWCFLLDDRKKEAMVDWLIKGDETAADRLTSIAVQNGTNVRGAAGRVAAQLKADGFDAKPDTTSPRPPAVPEAGAAVAAPVAPSEIAVTRIVYAKAAVASRAQHIAQLLGVPATQVLKEAKVDTTGSFSENPADITVVLGRDLAAGANAPRTAGL